MKVLKLEQRGRMGGIFEDMLTRIFQNCGKYYGIVSGSHTNQEQDK